MAILDDLLNRLSENPPRLPSWIYVPTTSASPILGAIRYWIDAARISKTEKTLKLHEIPDTPLSMPPAMGMPGPMFSQPGSLGAYADKLTQDAASACLEGMTGENLVQTGLIPAYVSQNRARQYYKRHKSQLVEAMVERMKEEFSSASTDIETKWYTMTKTLPIPKELEQRHVFLKQFSDAMRRNKEIPSALISKVAPSG